MVAKNRYMAVLLLLVFRFIRLLLSGHHAVALENAALRMQIAAFSAKAKTAAAVDLGPGLLDYPPQPMGRLAQAVVVPPGRHRRLMAARSASGDSGLGFPNRSAGAEVAPAPVQNSAD